MTKFDAIFCSNCPFTSYLDRGHGFGKGFIRTVDYVRYAAQRYNRANGYADFTGDWDARAIEFKHIKIYEERNDLNEIALMRFEDGNGELWLVTIVEYDE